MSILEGTVDLTKVLNQPPETVFSAWSSEHALRQWGDPGEGWEMTFDKFHFAVGQADICRFGPKDGQQYINENNYLEIEPANRIVYATSLRTEGKLSFAGTVAVTFEKTKDGTRMRLIEQGLYFDDLDDVEGHRAGWETMLGALARYAADIEP